jgi:hypothetical protein
MLTNTTTWHFPQGEVSIVHQNGSKLTPFSKGMEIILHTREGEYAPCCAELISGDHYAEIGLWFEGNQLVDFDGIFWLPHELGGLLVCSGYLVSNELYG